MVEWPHMHVVNPPWTQRLREPDDAFEAFEHWLKASPRPLPHERWSQEWDWAGRALAYDSTQELPSDPRSQLLETHSLLTQSAYHEARKLLSAASQSRGAVLKPRELILILTYLQENADLLRALLGETESELDLSNLSDEDYKKLRELKASLKKRTG